MIHLELDCETLCEDKASVSCLYFLWNELWLFLNIGNEYLAYNIFMSHIRAVERRVHGLTHLYWTCWKNQTEASLLYTQQVSDQHEWTLIIMIAWQYLSVIELPSNQDVWGPNF